MAEQRSDETGGGPFEQLLAAWAAFARAQAAAGEAQPEEADLIARLLHSWRAFTRQAAADT
ncbi:MAG: hypothetical protein KC425_27165, partial [Anaerolineales bacterium]|nr:hypothetical protein [Anaerolineales bacterium]